MKLKFKKMTYSACSGGNLPTPLKYVNNSPPLTSSKTTYKYFLSWLKPSVWTKKG